MISEEHHFKDMQHYSVKRFIYTLWLFATIFLFPWWVVGIFACIGVILFDRFFEIIAVGILLDVLFGFPGNRWYVTGLHTALFSGLVILGIIINKMFTRPKSFNKL